VPQTAPLRAVSIDVFTLIIQDRIFVEIREVLLFIQTYLVIWRQTLGICTRLEHYEVCNSASRLTTFVELDCNATCHCDRNKFSPICGRDKNTYFSACHAGCQNM